MYETSSTAAHALGALRDQPGPAGERWSEAERGRALEKLTVFSLKVDFEATFLRATRAFWGPLARLIPGEEMLRLHADPAVAFNFQGYYAIEFEAEGGRSIAELFLDRHERRLPPGERAFLQALARSRLGVYELCRSGEGHLLREIWRGGEEFPIEEPGAVYGLRRGELIATRLTRPVGGRVAFEWDLYVFPGRVREELLGALPVEAPGPGAERARSRRACARVHRLLYRMATSGGDGTGEE